MEQQSALLAVWMQGASIAALSSLLEQQPAAIEDHLRGELHKIRTEAVAPAVIPIDVGRQQGILVVRLADSLRSEVDSRLDLLQIDAGAEERRVARLACAGGPPPTVITGALAVPPSQAAPATPVWSEAMEARRVALTEALADAGIRPETSTACRWGAAWNEVRAEAGRAARRSVVDALRRKCATRRAGSLASAGADDRARRRDREAALEVRDRRQDPGHHRRRGSRTRSR